MLEIQLIILVLIGLIIYLTVTSKNNRGLICMLIVYNYQSIAKN